MIPQRQRFNLSKEVDGQQCHYEHFKRAPALTQAQLDTPVADGV
jgi:hypothetical protein